MKRLRYVVMKTKKIWGLALIIVAALSVASPVDKVADQIISAIRKKKTKEYVTKRWHFLAIINKNLPFTLYRLL